MVDFKKLAEQNYKRATPEERARIDAYREREARLDTTRRAIEATFIRYSFSRSDPTLREEDRWTKQIEMRIEDRTDHKGRAFEIVQFIGGSTGYEAYELGEDLISALKEEHEGEFEDVFSICAGSARYYGCRVSASAVLNYLNEVRPELFQDATPAMGR